MATEELVKTAVGGIVSIKALQILDKQISKGLKQKNEKFFLGLPKNRGKLL